MKSTRSGSTVASVRGRPVPDASGPHDIEATPQGSRKRPFEKSPPGSGLVGVAQATRLSRPATRRTERRQSLDPTEIVRSRQGSSPGASWRSQSGEADRAASRRPVSRSSITAEGGREEAENREALLAAANVGGGKLWFGRSGVCLCIPRASAVILASGSWLYFVAPMFLPSLLVSLAVGIRKCSGSRAVFAKCSGSKTHKTLVFIGL